MLQEALLLTYLSPDYFANDALRNIRYCWPVSGPVETVKVDRVLFNPFFMKRVKDKP